MHSDSEGGSIVDVLCIYMCMLFTAWEESMRTCEFSVGTVSLMCLCRCDVTR